MDEQTGKPHISESLCIGCGICINKCPHDALIIENLPSELETDMIHRYSMNGFRLFRLPTPSKESVVGILGPNGMGKSTAISALSGRIVPNLGDWLNQEADWDDVVDSLPKGELRDFFIAVQKGKVRVAVKPQNVDKLPKRISGTVADLLGKVDERGLLEETTRSLGIDHLMQRTVQQLSGGELQRMAIAATILRDVDVYFFDEPSSYLDIHERMRIVRIIQDLAQTKRVIVIEHDLAVLDVLADLIHIVYGKKGAFGIFTPARSTRQAINSYLDGFLPEENVRIRDKPIKFLRHRDRSVEIGTPVVSWGGLEKTLGEFHLTSGEGAVHRSEVVGVVGSNGTGKSTMIKILAGEHEYDAGSRPTPPSRTNLNTSMWTSTVRSSFGWTVNSVLGGAAVSSTSTSSKHWASISCCPNASRSSLEGNGKRFPSLCASVGTPTSTCSMSRPLISTPTPGWRPRKPSDERWRRTKNRRL